MFERSGIVAELDADFRQDAVGGVLDAREVLLAEDVVGRDVAQDIGPPEARRALLARLALRRAPAPLYRFRHRPPPLHLSGLC